MEHDLAKAKREQLRWQILMTLNAGRPVSLNEQFILGVVSDLPLDVTPLELRRELDYLEERGLVKLVRKQLWTADLTRDGVDVVEYTVDCDPGIARPRKYW